MTADKDKRGRVSRNPTAFILCAEHGVNLAGASPVTGIYRQV